MPRVTVICPTWNRGAAILPTLESVRAQEFRDWELIVASDGSSDDTDDVVASFVEREPRARLLRTRRFGFQAGPTNIALGEAAGEIVAYLDHDDRFLPDHLSRMVAEFDRGAQFVATRARKVDQRGRQTYHVHPLYLVWHPELQLMNPLFENSCAAHHTDLADKVGGWRESEVGLEDWDLWLRLADEGVRCATVLATTVELLEDPATRQHNLPLRYGMEIARFPDMRSARAGYRALTDSRRYEEAYAACSADVQAWFTDLVASPGGVVLPRGWEGGLDALPAAVDDSLREAGTVWKTLVIEPAEDHVSLQMALATMTAEHAERYIACFRRSMPRQLEYFASVLTDGVVTR